MTINSDVAQRLEWVTLMKAMRTPGLDPRAVYKMPGHAKGPVGDRV